MLQLINGGIEVKKIPESEFFDINITPQQGPCAAKYIINGQMYCNTIAGNLIYYATVFYGCKPTQTSNYRPSMQETIQFGGIINKVDIIEATSLDDLKIKFKEVYNKHFNLNEAENFLDHCNSNGLKVFGTYDHTLTLKITTNKCELCFTFSAEKLIVTWSRTKKVLLIIPYNTKIGNASSPMDYKKIIEGAIQEALDHETRTKNKANKKLEKKLSETPDFLTVIEKILRDENVDFHKFHYGGIKMIKCKFKGEFDVYAFEQNGEFNVKFGSMSTKNHSLGLFADPKSECIEIFIKILNKFKETDQLLGFK